MAAEAEALRAKGKKLCGRGRWSEAAVVYGKYIDAVRSQKGEVREKLVIGYSNRAEVWLQLQNYANALDDAERALTLDPPHLKSLVRKARALSALKLYKDAQSIFEDLLKKDGIDAEYKQTLRASLKVASMKDMQTRFGKFKDFAGHCTGQSDLPDGFEEFVGPVELKRTAGMARGLFATRDLAPGDLIFVSSPMVSVMHPKGDAVDPEVTSTLIADLKKRVEYARDNLIDFSQIQFLVQLDTLAGPYPDGPLSRDTPPMRYFTPVNALPEDLREIKIPGEETPVIRTQFDLATQFDVIIRRRYTLWLQPGMSTGNGEVTGIFCLPSLINHSCLPNATMITGGPATGDREGGGAILLVS
ncbi:hypothetical protein R1flu_000340 [Riccia fluitans]|uniref:SET domain-containing protein n=1 Tax=Riccia fluitans TaxID=41844 RepID=A0ABD1Y0M9_9MARC